ncbi:Uncharacterised protein [Corynebacterium renale]|uniref:TRAFAC clade GTPase domain-containing protein n=1 Tax=Corynebacterium renale TaxID=1724 RepID=UPI000DA38CC7|nr:hypothetical protein [Corynebacterium renale]SQG63567.1 Uncharacterised protein [Corynebacterium renale]STD00931.1 Uncharacterised protein [Corynebacterium renale]
MTFAKNPYTFRPLQGGENLSTGSLDIPEDWADSVTHCVALAGARSSGKSLYLAVLIKQLELLGERFQRPIQYLDESTQSRYEQNYERPLYEEMQHMAPTPPSGAQDAYQRDPFVFSLGKWVDPSGAERMHYLVIRDVAGEDLEVLPDDRSSLDFFPHADLIVFMFDPLREEQVRLRLDGLIPTAQTTGADPEQVLRNLVELLDDQRPPLAITISKFDALQKLADLPSGDLKEIMDNPGAAFRRDTGMNYDAGDQYLVSAETESLLQYLGASRLVNQIRELYAPSAQFQYFAVSALGESPKGSHLSRQGIAPYRVLDPVRWVINGKGVFNENARI